MEILPDKDIAIHKASGSHFHKKGNMEQFEKTMKSVYGFNVQWKKKDLLMMVTNQVFTVLTVR